MKKLLFSLLASCALSGAAFAGPISPDGAGIDLGLSRTITIPAGQAMKLVVRYKADKEVRAQIWYSDNDEQLGTNSNTYAPNGFTFTLPEQGYPREFNISGWSKNCWKGEKKCSRIPWTQEPYHIFSETRTVGFEDSYDGEWIPGTYDDITVTVTCLNDKAACPI